VARFPKSFLWGASLSAHQVEGEDIASDWWAWEQRPGRIVDGSTSQRGAGHLSRFPEDAALARKLGHNALLLSLSWPRLQPRAGHSQELDPVAVAHYSAVLETWTRAGIMPIVALQHVTVPQWFQARGGWEHPRAAEAFAGYVRAAVGALAPWCHWWLPMLEPLLWLERAHGERAWPGAGGRLLGWRKAVSQCVRAQQLANAAIHDIQDGAQAGLSLCGNAMSPEDANSAGDLRAARRLEAWHRDWLPPQVADCDFIALSYTGTNTVRFAPLRPVSRFARRDNDAPVAPTPSGLVDALDAVQAHGKPLFVTGNGVATGDDRERCRYLLDHISVLEGCVRAGMPVQGYFHRALLDGWEWTAGHNQRYGLVHVARETLARTPNISAFLYKSIIEARGIPGGAVERYCPEWERLQIGGAETVGVLAP